jgi:hypothetical protein
MARREPENIREERAMGKTWQGDERGAYEWEGHESARGYGYPPPDFRDSTASAAPCDPICGWPEKEKERVMDNNCFICQRPLEARNRKVFCECHNVSAHYVGDTGLRICTECDKGLVEKKPEIIEKLIARFEEGRGLGEEISECMILARGKANEG